MIALPPRSAPIALLAFVACGPVAAPLAPPSAVEITVAPGEAPPAPPPPVEPAPPPPAAAEILAPPAPLGCEIAGKRAFSPFEGVPPLCLAAAGPCFGRAAVLPHAIKLTASYAEGDAQSAGVVVELDDGKIAVRGITKTGEVKLYPRLIFTVGSPTAAGDFIVPMTRVLEVERASRGTVEVALALDPDVSLPGGVARAQRRCDELSIDANRFGPEEVRRFVAGKPVLATPQGTADMLPVGKETPLSTAPGLPPAAVLLPGQVFMADVDVVERRGRDARIVWMRDGYAVYGWVPARAITRSQPVGLIGLLNGAPGAAPARPNGQTFACNAELRLLVEIAGRRVDVGKIRKGTRIATGARRDGLVVVDLLGGPVDAQRGAVWLVHEAEFTKACAPS